MIHKAVKYLSLCFVLLALSLLPAAAQQGSEKPTTNQPNPLIQVLRANGVLSAEDVAKIKQATSAQEAQKRLEDILLSKKVITKEQYDQVISQQAPSAVPNAPSPVVPVAQPQAIEQRPVVP